MKAILFIFTFCMTSSWALPGMTNVRMDFKGLEESLSSSAINCVKTNSSEKGIAALSTYLNKIDCNSKTDPKEFCECISIISKDKFNISAEKEIEIIDYVKKMITQRNMQKAREDIYLSDSYLDLSMTISGTDKVDKCFVPDVTNQNLLSINEQRAKKSTSINDQAKINTYDEIYADLKNNHFDRAKELIQLNNYMIQLREQKTENFDWDSLAEISPYFKMMSKSKRRNFKLNKQLKSYTDVQKLGHSLIDLPFVGIGHNIRIDLSKGMRDLQQDQNKILTAGFANKIIDTECRAFRKIVDEALNFNLDEQVDVMMKSIISPETKEDYQTLKKVEEFLAAKFNQDDISQKMFLFDIDRLYCSKKELSHVFQTLDKHEDIIKSKSAALKDYEESLKVLHDLMDETALELESINAELAEEKGALEISYVEKLVFSSLEREEFTKVVDGKKVIDLENPEFRDLLNKCDSLKCNPLLTAVGLVPYISYDEFKPELDMILKGHKELSDDERQERISVLSARQSEAQTKLEYVKKGYNDVNDAKKKFVMELKKEYGEQGYSEILASSETGQRYLKNFNQNIGVTTNKKSRRERVQEALAKINLQAKERNFIASSSSTAREKTSTIEAPIGRVQTIQSEGVISTLGKYFKGTGAPAKTSETSSVPSKVEQEEQFQQKSEIEEAIARLEKLVSDSSKEAQASTSSKSDEDREIADLKNRIELEKLNIEKANLEKKIAQSKQKKAGLKNKVVQSRPAGNSIVSSNTPAIRTGNSSFEAQSSSSATSFSPVKKSSSSVGTSVPTAIAPIGSGAVSSSNTIAESNSTSTSSSETKSSRAPASSALSLLEESSNNYEIVNLSEISSNARASESRVVKIDFMVNQIEPTEREAFIKNLFYSGEESLIIELPDGEKLFVENTKNEKISPIGSSENIKKDVKDDDSKREREARKRYVDLKKLLKVGTSQQEFE